MRFFGNIKCRKILREFNIYIYIYIYIYTRFQKHCNLKNIYTYIHLLSSQRENKRYIYMYIYFSSCNVFENGCIYIYIYSLKESEDGQLLTIKKLKNLIKNKNVSDL